LRANDELQQFDYAVSHDLQEPLRTLANFTRLLAREAKGRLGPDADEYMDYILDGTRRMRALIDGLLALSRAGETAGRPMGPVNTAEVVAECIRNLQAAVEESGARIVFERLPGVHGNAPQLGQLFQNLLSNAIKYRKPELAPLIEIFATPRQGGEWLFAVRDNGVGFDRAQGQTVFGPFRRLHGRDIPGTGIGLSLCRRILDRHGGEIWAEGVPGEGATFYLTLQPAKLPS
jgi:light-regulated signal transduction histidine kinase (bacteriophytochrome)